MYLFYIIEWHLLSSKGQQVVRVKVGLMSHRNDDGGQFSTPHSRSTEVVPATANRDGIIYFSNHPGASIAIASAAAGAAINTVGLATEHEQFDDEKWNDGGSPASRSLGGWWLGMFFIFLVRTMQSISVPNKHFTKTGSRMLVVPIC